MSKSGNSWAPSSGVSFIPGDGRPTPGVMILEAEEMAALNRRSEDLERTIALKAEDLPKPAVPGVSISINPQIQKAQK